MTEGGRIRVARVITRLNVGGPAFQAILLTERLDPLRYDTALFAGSADTDEGEILDLRPDLGRPPRRVPGLRRAVAPLDDARALAALVRLFSAFRPHIVHTHMAKAGLLGRLAARLCGVPVVIHTFHGNVLRGYFDPLRTRAFLTLERALARASTRIVAISNRQARELAALGIAKAPRLIRLPLGLELGPFLAAERGALRAELGVGDDVPLIGIVARLVPIKGVDVFVEAAAIVARDVPRAVFVIVGDGPLRASLTRLASERGLDRRLHFLGLRADTAHIYADLDVVALTSRNEGTPVTLIEALATRRAVVATDVGGVSDVVRDRIDGLLVPSGDASAVARAMGELVRDAAKREALGTAGRAHVYPEYDAATLVSRVDALYSGLMGERAIRGKARP